MTHSGHGLGRKKQLFQYLLLVPVNGMEELNSQPKLKKGENERIHHIYPVVCCVSI